MVSLNLKTWFKKSSAVLFLWSTTTLPVIAARLPFEKVTADFQTSVMVWVTAAAGIMMTITCVMLGFGEWTDGFKKFLNFLFWVSLALGGGSIIAWIKS
jgi:hypothetical protein